MNKQYAALFISVWMLSSVALANYSSVAIGPYQNSGIGDALTPWEADTAALQYCGTDCNIVARYTTSEYVAIAFGPGHFGVGNDPTFVQNAEDFAVLYCQGQYPNQVPCTVTYATHCD